MSIGVVLAMLLVFVGLLFVVLGLYQTLLDGFRPWQAGLLIALGAIILALLVLIIARITAKRGAARATPPPLAQTDADIDAAAQIGATISDFVARGKPSSMQLGVAAFIAGLALSLTRRRPPPGGKDDS